MLAVLLLVGLSVTNSRDVEVVRVDRLDVNHIYRWDGSIRLDQLILWRWSNLDRRFYAVGWSILRGRTTDDAEHRAAWNRMIRKTHKGKPNEPWPKYSGKWIGCKEVPRFDGRHYVSDVVRNGKRYRIKADFVIETHTMTDPEADNRRDYPGIKAAW